MLHMTHTPEFNAYYKGRNSIWNEEPRANRADFQTIGEWNSYKRGRRHAQQEERLDLDTEWDD
jgi:hypothetical protein